MRLGFDVEQIYEACKIDQWFLEQIARHRRDERTRAQPRPADDAGRVPAAEVHGLFGRAASPCSRGSARRRSRGAAAALDVLPVYKRIDTCAAEFASPTAYMYSTYAPPFAGKPARRVAARRTARRSSSSAAGRTASARASSSTIAAATPASRWTRPGYETIMVNCNPETVSTDYDTSDRLYFEPLTAEDVLEILHKEQENGTLLGVIVQFGGQTPLKLAKALEEAGIPILGTSPDMIDLAEDRDRFKRLLDKLGLKQPEERHRLFGRAEPRCRRRPRPAARRAPVLCAGRPRHGDHPRRGDVRRLSARHPARAGARRGQGALSQRQDRPDQHGSGQEPAAVRPLPVRRHRGRRRLPVRRQGRLHRRHHGAHRGSGHPFRRFGLLAAAALAVAGDHRRARAPDARRWRWRSTSAA